VLTAEASACAKALQAATEVGISRIQMEVDSSILKQALLLPSSDLAASGMLIRDTRHLLHEHFICNDIFLVPRACNSVAHNLASLGMSWDPDESCIWTSTLPDSVKSLVARDSVEPSISITRPKGQFKSFKNISKNFQKPTPNLYSFGNIEKTALQQLPISTHNLFALRKINQIAQNVRVRINRLIFIF